MKRKGPIRKDYFPVLLKHTLQNMNASGLYPLEVNHVLSHLPEEPAPGEREKNCSEWERTFTDPLKERRNKETATNPKRKKNDVISDKSVACEKIIA
ncbi:hypothetical protein JTB14_018915 [Gonioctena quinquepunctata]|nr:hypothetical protein JTB14_018915 [Gonioctena quinquepunctata]